MNEGLKIARGDFLIIMNPDTRILLGFREMTYFLGVHPEIGAIGPQLIDKEGNIQDSCRNYITLPRFLIRNLKKIFFRQELIHEKGIDYREVQTSDWIIGAFIMVKREVYLRTQGLDTGYFLYCEDMDWRTRIRVQGYEVVYFPSMKVEYTGSRAARSSLKYTRIFLKSLIRYWNRFGYFIIRPKRRKLIYKYTP
ncbi:MAG: hypothetical protein LUD15_02675 [Bacteroides sp.]|nr:hypothetical protein [Bacteroides sp.]